MRLIAWGELEMNDKSRFLQGLTVATNVAILIIALLMLFAFSYNFIASHGQHAAQSKRFVNEPAPHVDGVDYARRAKTLVLAVSTRCHFCLDSVPFYQSLPGAVGTKDVQIIAVFPNSKQDVDEFLRLHKLGLPSLANSDFARLGIHSTPTALLVNGRGIVIDSWIGELSPAQQTQLIREIQAD
jgi:hypothetical protein